MLPIIELLIVLTPIVYSIISYFKDEGVKSVTSFSVMIFIIFIVVRKVF